MSVTMQKNQYVKGAKADALHALVSHVLPYHIFWVSEADADYKKRNAVRRVLLLLLPGIKD